MIKLGTKSFICIKSCDGFLTEGKEYIGEHTSRGVFIIRDNGDESWVVSDKFFLEKSEYIRKERDNKINKIVDGVR